MFVCDPSLDRRAPTRPSPYSACRALCWCGPLAAESFGSAQLGVALELRPAESTSIAPAP
jgi:hypothetical protein